MFDRRMLGVVNAIECDSTNVLAESVNGAIQELKTIGRGYTNSQKFIKSEQKNESIFITLDKMEACNAEAHHARDKLVDRNKLITQNK